MIIQLHMEADTTAKSTSGTKINFKLLYKNFMKQTGVTLSLVSSVDSVTVDDWKVVDMATCDNCVPGIKENCWKRAMRLGPGCNNSNSTPS
jgi:hypothetical protein